MNTKSHKPKIFILALILLFFHPLTLFGGETTVNLDPIEVKASRSTLSAKNQPSSMTVISREEIKKSQYLQVKDIIRETLGADVVSSGPLGSNTTVFMRGAGSSSTLVMIDGIQVNASTTGAFNFGNLIVDNIERVEIMRGPQSTLWGADAVGGVINIIIKKGAGTPSHSASFEGGSFGRFKETFGSSGALNNIDYSFTASRTDNDGFSSANKKNGNTENDGYEATNLSGRLGYNFLGDGRVEIISRYTSSVVDFDGFDFATSKPTDSTGHNNTDSFYLATPIQKSLTDWWHIRLNPNISYDQGENIDPTFSNSTIYNRNYTLDLQNNLQLGRYYSAVAGFEYQVLNGNNVEQGLNRDIFQQGYFLQTQFNYEDRIIMTGGFRHDVNSKFKNKTTYKFAGAYRLKEWGTTLRASGSTGFRVPSLNDLFFPNFGNPDLQPEESKSREVGIEQELFDGRVNLGITYFNSDLTNLIQFDIQTFLPQNVGKSSSNGTESFLKFKITPDFDLSLTHTWNEAIDGDGSPLRRRAKHKLTTTFHHNWQNKLDSRLTLYHKSGIRDGNFSADAFTTVRAVLSYQLAKNLRITARGENLFDEDYEEIPNFGTAGVSGFAGLTYNF